MLALALMVASLLSLAPRATFAQAGTSAGNTTVARTLFREGIAATRAEDWQRARDAFARSFELAPRATTLLNLAGTERQLGSWVAAAESYRRFLAMAGRGRRSRAQRRVARQALAELEPQIPSIRVSRGGAEYADVDVTVDGEAMPSAALGELFPVDPGEHALRMEREGYRSVELNIDLEAGATEELSLADQVWHPLALDPAQVARDGSQAEPAGGLVDSREGPSSGSIWHSPVFWIVVGAVVVGAVVAGVVAGSGGPSRYSGNVPPGRLEVP